MVCKRFLLMFLFAGSSAALAVPQPQLFSATATTSSRSKWTSLALQTTGGSDTAPPPDLKAPPALYQGAVAAGAAKAAAPLSKIFTMGVVAGCHIAFGAYLAISVGGACPGLAQTNPGLQKMIMVCIVVVCDTVSLYVFLLTLEMSERRMPMFCSARRQLTFWSAISRHVSF